MGLALPPADHLLDPGAHLHLTAIYGVLSSVLSAADKNFSDVWSLRYSLFEYYVTEMCSRNMKEKCVAETWCF